LRSAVSAEDVPGIVAMAASEAGVVYEGAFGSRRIHEAPAMTRDTIFRVASMVKLITSVAALQLVEQGKLSLEAPVPAIDPAIAVPQVLHGFDTAGRPLLRPAKRPISLHDLLTHTAGFVYRLWDSEALTRPSTNCLPPSEGSFRAFDPGAGCIPLPKLLDFQRPAFPASSMKEGRWAWRPVGLD